MEGVRAGLNPWVRAGSREELEAPRGRPGVQRMLVQKRWSFS